MWIVKAHNITITSSSGDHHGKSFVKMEVPESSSLQLGMASFANVTNTAYDQPKRTRFSFKSEHLLVYIFILCLSTLTG